MKQCYLKLFPIVFFVSFFPAYAQSNNKDSQMVDQCLDLARYVQSDLKLKNNITDINPIFTWRSSCSKSPPYGKGDIISLCEGSVNNKQLIFWEKRYEGRKIKNYEWCVE